jgi:ABC-type transport system involved in multi-copper enzyme maturation permease subunit
LRSRNFLALVSKEWRELMASRAFWLLLLMIGPLVGHGFIVAVKLYAEASGFGGGAAALAQGLTPLDGILVPTFGAYDLAATFLLPFVAIRMISAEKENGGLKLLLQFPGSLGAKMAAKGLALFGGWLIVLLPGLLAIVLWEIYGGHLYAPETLNLLLGHLLRAMLNGGIALAAAALAESAASAAIVTLGITVGTWALDFLAAGRGGFLQQLASFTPTAAIRFFEQGLLRLNTVAVMLAISIAGFAVAAIWLEMGRAVRSRALRMTVVMAAMLVVMAGAATLQASFDTSENRRNSFSRADEEALARIGQPLRVTAFLAPEDPRLTDLEQSVVKKLRRILASVEVEYIAGGTSGLFEASGDHYGEIWYEMNGKRVMERSTIEPVVLEQIYRLAGVQPPQPTTEDEFGGYPLAARPIGAAWIFYGLWPLATALLWWLIRR